MLKATLTILAAYCVVGAPALNAQVTKTKTKTPDSTVKVEVPAQGMGAVVDQNPPVVNPTPRTKARAETRKTTRSESSARSEGLTYTQLLALQQQLRDEGCGIDHVTGVLDAATRRAIAQCKKKYGVTGNGRDLLIAMNIGFDANMSDTGMGSIMKKNNE